ncbi:MAG: hypothetical protein AAGF58_08505 [Pseudomonadota bacterium]
MPVQPSGSLLQALSSLVQPANGGPAKAAKPPSASFQQHIDPVSAKFRGDEKQGDRRQNNTGQAPGAAPAPPPGRGSIINIVV